MAWLDFREDTVEFSLSFTSKPPSFFHLAHGEASMFSLAMRELLKDLAVLECTIVVLAVWSYLSIEFLIASLVIIEELTIDHHSIFLL